MTYLLSQIFISLLLAALAGGGIGWIAHGLRSRRREDKLNSLIQRQAGALKQAQQERQMIADDYDDMKLGLESRVGELQLANRKLPEYEKNLEKSQQLVQQMMKSHESEIAESTTLNNQLQNELDSLRVQQKSDHSEITALRKSNAELGGNNNYARPASSHDTDHVNVALDSVSADKTNTTDAHQIQTNSSSNRANNLAEEQTTSSRSGQSTVATSGSTNQTERIAADHTLGESALGSAVTQAELLELESEIEEMRGYNRDHSTTPASPSVTGHTTRESHSDSVRSSTSAVTTAAAGAAALSASSGSTSSTALETDSFNNESGIEEHSNTPRRRQQRLQTFVNE